MARPARRNGIALGLIGVGPIWERRYRDAVRSLSDRVQIRAVYDAVYSRAQAVATELDAEPVQGLRQLYERADLKGVLILDPAWYDLFPAELACRHQKPAFLAGTLGENLSGLESLHRLAVEQSTLLMTEFSLRHTPATSRLQELIATRLGRAQRVSIEAALPDSTTDALPGQATRAQLLVGLLDWCTYVTGRTPLSLRAQSSTAGPTCVELGFRADIAGRPITTARIAFHAEASSESESTPSYFARHEVQCEHGQAVISRQDAIAWQNGTGECCENLTAERTEAQRMIDQFCRRLHGGLVPVADIHDAWRAISLARAAEHCLETGAEAVGPWIAPS